MASGTSNRTALRYVLEVTPGTTPATPTLKEINYLSESIVDNIQYIRSQHIRADRNRHVFNWHAKERYDCSVVYHSKAHARCRFGSRCIYQPCGMPNWRPHSGLQSRTDCSGQMVDYGLFWCYGSGTDRRRNCHSAANHGLNDCIEQRGSNQGKYGCYHRAVSKDFAQHSEQLACH